MYFLVVFCYDFVPNFRQTDSVLVFRNRKLKLIQSNSPKKRYFVHAIMLSDSNIWRISSYNTDLQSGLMFNADYLGDLNGEISWQREDETYQILMPDEDKKQIFLAPDEFPTELIVLPNKKHLLLTSELNYALLDENGVSLKRKGFFSTLYVAITDIYPKRYKILEVETPEFTVIRYLAVLYGLIPLWLLSMIIYWLINILRKKPKFSVRDYHVPLSVKMFPGSILYLIFFAINIVDLLKDFSIL